MFSIDNTHFRLLWGLFLGGIQDLGFDFHIPKSISMDGGSGNICEAYN